MSLVIFGIGIGIQMMFHHYNLYKINKAHLERLAMVETYRDKFNKKYGFPKGSSHSLSEISKKTGYKKSGLEKIVEKGQGAFYSNPESVRPHVKDPTHWGLARVYSAVMGGAASKIDKDLLKK